jgi:hypothetical protein
MPKGPASSTRTKVTQVDSNLLEVEKAAPRVCDGGGYPMYAAALLVGSLGQQSGAGCRRGLQNTMSARLACLCVCVCVCARVCASWVSRMVAVLRQRSLPQKDR